MKEEFLHYLWEFQKWNGNGLLTSEGSPLQVLSPGVHNFSSGPDFFNSQLVIGEQKWAGNVEIHLNSSDWYAHHHQTDTSYDNVILHVVWNHDAEVFRKDNSPIPVLEVEAVIARNAIANYEHLMKGPPGKWINCEEDFREFEEFHLQSWLERLYLERLEEKTAFIEKLLKGSENDWEQVLFKLLAKNFGLNLNGEAFLSLAESVPFSLIRRLASDQKGLEAVFLGQAGFLETASPPFERGGDAHYRALREIYRFLKYKHSLQNTGVMPMVFFRLRPDNFPNIRLSQLASLYHKTPRLFSEVINAENTEELYKLLNISASEYWETHYTFRKAHKRRRKAVSRNFMDLLIINSLVPLKFCYAKAMGKDINEKLLGLMGSLPRELNNITRGFEGLRGKVFENALQSQALLQLKKHYCDNHQCLKCRLGVQLLQRS